MKLYKHEKNTEVAMQIKKAIRVNDGVKDGWDLKINWFNIVNPSNTFLIGQDNIFINRVDRKNWKRFYVAV